MPTSPKMFKRDGDRIACMLIEPIMGNVSVLRPTPSIRARAISLRQHGVVMLIARSEDWISSGSRRRARALWNQGGLVHFCQGLGQRLSHFGAGGARRDHAQNRPRRGSRRHLHGALGVAGGRGETLQILDETDALERVADFGTELRNGMRAVLSARGIAHSFVGHPSMSGLYFAHEPPRNYRAWKSSDDSFYDAMARVLHDEKVLCEPDSREPWFISAAHDAGCLTDTLRAFEIAVDVTLKSSGAAHKAPA